MSRKTTHDGKVVGVTAATVSTAAVACVLPFALPTATLASFGGVIAWLTDAHPMISSAALLLVIAAWLWVRSYRSKARPADTTLLVMLLATAMLGLALLWPSLEPSAIALLSG